MYETGTEIRFWIELHFKWNSHYEAEIVGILARGELTPDLISGVIENRVKLSGRMYVAISLGYVGRLSHSAQERLDQVLTDHPELDSHTKIVKDLARICYRESSTWSDPWDDREEYLNSDRCFRAVDEIWADPHAYDPENPEAF